MARLSGSLTLRIIVELERETEYHSVRSPPDALLDANAMRRWLLIAAVAAVLAGACSGGSGEEPGLDGAPRVLASTSIIAEFARTVAGEDASVTTLIPAGVDVHGFEPSIDVVRAIAEADAIFINGYNLEAGVLDVIAANRRSDAPLVAVSAGIEPIGGRAPSAPPPAAEGLATAEGDPHFWLDPDNASRYALTIGEALAAVDPEHATAYRERAAAAAAELAALGDELRATLAVIPTPRRKLVVFHDGFAYFARAFEFELVASVLPAGPAREPSPAAVADVVALVLSEDVPALFSEPQFSSGVLALVAEESGAAVLTLLSVPVPPIADSYAAMMRANARALVAGLAVDSPP